MQQEDGHQWTRKQVLTTESESALILNFPGSRTGEINLYINKPPVYGVCQSSPNSGGDAEQSQWNRVHRRVSEKHKAYEDNPKLTKAVGTPAQHLPCPTRKWTCCRPVLYDS